MEKFMSRYVLIILLVMTGIFFHACKSTRSLYKKPIKEEGPEYIFGKLKENELNFEWLTAKFSLELLVDRDLTTFKGQLRIKRDSLIWVSFSPALGVEAARLMITEDSVKFINRINDTYFIGDYSYVNNFLKTSINFDILQSFIIGNDFQHYETGKFRASIDAMEYRLSATARHKLKKYIKQHEIPQVFIQNLWLNPETFKITKVNIKEVDKDNKKLQAYYGRFKIVEGQLFPTKLDYEITSSDTKIDVDVRFNRIILNRPVRFPFNIPSKFKRII